LQARRNQLIDRMKVIQDLQGTRPVIVRVFDEIVRTLPDGVYYKSIQSAGNKINIVGTAESNNRVSSLMRKLEASDWFANPILKGVKANPGFGEQGNDFELSIDVTMPGKTDESAGG
ncbi:MAG: PilN domain-containing protein, partial [Gammaproteobacteria bacterium]